jgi:hypothetical protein
MFELDEAKRIDVPAIMTHPWYTAPMRPEFENALQRLHLEQEIAEKKVGRGSTG